MLTQVDRLMSAATIVDLVAKTGPDPSLKAKLIKAREAAAAAQEASSKVKKDKGKKPSAQGQGGGVKRGAAEATLQKENKLSGNEPSAKKIKVELNPTKGKASKAIEANAAQPLKPLSGARAAQQPSGISSAGSEAARGSQKHLLTGKKPEGSKPKKPKTPVPT